MAKTVIRITTALALWVALTPVLAITLEGRVVKIADGDTLTMLVDGQRERIRLSDIDTPERKQPFGMRAKQALAEMTFGKTISVSTTTRDRYGRVIGQITVDGVDVNAELVRLGYAWVYRRYSNDAELLRLEKTARAEGLGLWADRDPIPPWEWRRGRRPSSASLRISETPLPTVVAGHQVQSKFCGMCKTSPLVAPAS
ncbi:MAG: thermonuclease family protein [Rhodothermia bacterium]